MKSGHEHMIIRLDGFPLMTSYFEGRDVRILGNDYDRLRRGKVAFP